MCTNKTIMYVNYETKLFISQAFGFCHKLSVSVPNFLFLFLNFVDIKQKHKKFSTICPSISLTFCMFVPQ